MLRDIAGIRLCGANFDEVTNILLLDPHEGNKVKPVKGTLLYGRNGAGKSTLAKAVRKAKGESQDTISQAEFLSINNLPIAPGDYTLNIYSEINNEVADWLTEVLPFSVIEKDYYKTGKLIPENQGSMLLNFNVK